MSITKKIISIFSLVIFVILTTCLTSTYYLAHQQILKQEKDKGLAVLKVFEASMTKDNTETNLQETLNTLKADYEEVVSFDIYKISDSGASNEIAGLDTKNIGKEADSEDVQAAKQDKSVVIIDNDVVDVTAPLHLNNKAAYVAGIEININDEISNLNMMLLKTLVLGIISLIVGILVIE